MHAYIKRKKSNWLTKVYILKWKRNILHYIHHISYWLTEDFFLANFLYIHYNIALRTENLNKRPIGHVTHLRNISNTNMSKGGWLNVTIMISPLQQASSFVQAYILHLWKLYAKFCWILPSSSGEKVVKCRPCFFAILLLSPIGKDCDPSC